MRLTLISLISGCLFDCLSDSLDDGLVEGVRDDVVFAELVIAHDGGDRSGGGDLHLFADVVCPGVKRTAEDAREDEHIVDLVREVAAAGGHDARAALLRFFRHDLRDRVGHGEDDGVIVHGSDHLCADDARGADADEHITSAHRVCQRAAQMLAVGLFGHRGLRRVHPCLSLAQDA